MDIYLDKEITEEVANALVFQIKNTKEDNLVIHINSPGGNIVDGYNLYNAILNFKGTTIAKIQGLAASMAFPIALACNNIEMSDFSLIMLHNPNFGDCVYDDKTNEILDKFKSSLLTIMHNRSGMKRETLAKMMTDETWLTADEVINLFGNTNIKVYTTKRGDLTNRLMKIYNKLNTMNMKEEDKEVTNELETKEEVKTETDVVNELETKEEEVVVDEVIVEEDKKEVTNEENMDEIMKATVTKLEEKISQLESELAKYKKDEEIKVEEEIENVLNSAKDRLTTEEYAKWKNIGKTDFSFMKSNIEKITKINIKNSAKVEDLITKKTQGDDLIDLRKLEKEDPTKLTNIFKNDFELYKKSFKNTYGVEYTNK